MFAFTGYAYIPLMSEEFDIYIDKFSLFKRETLSFHVIQSVLLFWFQACKFSCLARLINDRCGCVIYTLKYGEMTNACNITDSLTGIFYVDAESSSVPNFSYFETEQILATYKIVFRLKTENNSLLR